MGGAQEFTNSWMEDEVSSLEERDKSFEDGAMDFEDKILAQAIVAKSSTDPYHWEEESSNSQEGNFDGGKERLVIKFRRISQTYYMVDEVSTPEDSTSKYFNYKSIRYSFPTCFNVTPRKNNNPKVVRCKTCRKVFSRMATLKVHRRTHAAFAPGPYTPKDFAKRFSTNRMSREPYIPSAHLKLLENVTPHPREYPGYLSSPAPLPYIKPGSTLNLMDDTFSVGDMIGEGGFAKVYSATWENGPPEEKNTVLKVQMPANDWEWYILSQVDRRLEALAHPLKNEKGACWKGGFMTAPRCYTYRDGAVIISQHQKMGTLLDLVNLTKSADKNIIEPIAIYLTAELLGLMELLHSINIVHADLKPDNFLVRHTPSTQSSPSLQLIDFGKAIDIHLEPGDEKKAENGLQTGSTVANGESGANGRPEEKEAEEKENGSREEGEGNPKENCDADSANATKPDRKEETGEKSGGGRTGKYHLDYFGIAGAAYCLLFGKYIEVGTVKNRWVVKGSFKRWWQVKLWEQFFDDMLNPKGEEKDCLPSLLVWRQRLLDLFEIEDLREGLDKAREIIEIKLLEKWRRNL